MAQYPIDALEYLKHAGGLMTAVCAVYYDQYLENPLTAEKNFRIFCENINFIESDESLHIENGVAPEEYEKAYKRNKAIIEQIVANLQNKNSEENDFYKELWQQLQNEALLPTKIEKVAALIQLAELPQIPYFQLDEIEKMDDAQFQTYTEKVMPELKKAIFVIGYGYPQKTQVAEQLIKLATAIKDQKARTVFVAQIIAFYEASIQRFLSKTEAEEKADKTQAKLDLEGS